MTRSVGVYLVQVRLVNISGSIHCKKTRRDDEIEFCAIDSLNYRYFFVHRVYTLFKEKSKFLHSSGQFFVQLREFRRQPFVYYTFFQREYSYMTLYRLNCKT